MTRRAKPANPKEFLERYPRIVGHLICESLGYACRSKAALICYDGMLGKENWSEWILECYNRNARKALQDSIKHRHGHVGFMAHYPKARQLVEHVRKGGYDGDWFASWF